MPDRAALEAECAVFGRYLLGRAPEPAVVARYVEAHELGVVAPPAGADGFDRALVRSAGRGPGWARAMDAYARFAARGGLLRRKLVLLLALVESGPGAREVDTPTPGGLVGFAVGAAWAGVRFALLAAFAAVWTLPARLGALAAEPGA